MSQIRKTILYVHSSDELYGSDRMLLQLVRSLDRECYRAVVVLPSDVTPGGLLSSELARNEIDCRTIDLAVIRRRYLTCRGVLAFARRLFHSTIRLVLLIRRENVALVHTNTIVVWPGALAALLTRHPHVWQIHELLGGPTLLRSALARLLLALSSHVVSNSRATRRALFGSLSNDTRTSVIYNGIDLQTTDDDTVRTRLRSSWGVGSDQIVVGTIGRLSHRKGQQQLIEAIARVHMVQPQVHTVIVGGPVPGQEHFVTELRAYAARAGLAATITFTGFRHDVTDLLRAIDIFVMPSLLPESFGLVVVEAMASGKPVVSSNIGALSEVIIDGETGLLVRPGDPHALGDAILRLINDRALRERMGSAAYLHATKSYRLDSYSRQFSRLYCQVLARADARSERRSRGK